MCDFCTAKSNGGLASFGDDMPVSTDCCAVGANLRRTRGRWSFHIENLDSEGCCESAADVFVSHCPMCGRKLESEEATHE